MDQTAINSGPIDAAVFFTIPEGGAGTRETLKHMRELARVGKSDPVLRHLAQSIVANVPGKDWLGELTALFRFVQGRVRYSLDVNAVETLQPARLTLTLGYGDCDDMAIALAALAESLGHVCYLCAVGFDEPGAYSHVLVLASGAGETGLVSLDATETRPIGWFPPGVTCAMLAPID
jgi:hypothetical protein